VSTVELPAFIAGAIRFDAMQRGPGAMNMVADPNDAASVYMSWTENLPFGFSKNNDEGKIHVSKLEIHPTLPAVLKDDKVFDGFVVAGGIDITEDGIVGTLCAKYIDAWIDEFLSASMKYPGNTMYGPLLLAVCEVEAKTMTKRTPWRIGKLFTSKVDSGYMTKKDQRLVYTYGTYGNYPHSYGFTRVGGGYGHLVYCTKQQMWTTFYGATIGKHTGFAMHTYKKDAPKIQPEYKMPVPDTVVENREETVVPGNEKRHARGDHTAGSAMRYNPIVGDLYFQKHKHYEFNQQQFGFTPIQGVYVLGDQHGLDDGPIMKHGSDVGYLEGSMRPCGESMISAFISKHGSTCARMSKEGKIEAWRTISKQISVAGYDWDEDRYQRVDAIGLRMTRLATLGSPESEAKCGSEARFLMGYETEGLRRWLVEINGNCEPVSDPMDVTAHTSWPIMQEWTTTRDGAVVWTTAYREGRYWPDTSWTDLPLGKKWGGYPHKPSPLYPARFNENEGVKEKRSSSKGILPSQFPSKWAVVSVYWPSGRMPGREAFPPGPAPGPAPVAPQPGPGATPRPAPPSTSSRRRSSDSSRRRSSDDSSSSSRRRSSDDSSSSSRRRSSDDSSSRRRLSEDKKNPPLHSL